MDKNILLDMVNEMLVAKNPHTSTVATDVKSIKVGYHHSFGYQCISFIYYYKAKPGYFSIDGDGSSSWHFPLDDYRERLINSVL